MPMQFHNRSIRLDRSAPWVTYAYIALCILIYLADTVTQWLGWGGANTGYLSLMGMRINALITMGQWWRLITPMFLHGSIMHLLMNCFALYVWGRYAETFYGKGRYALILLLSGFTGCVAGYAFSTYNALGASGAILGILGSLLAFSKSHRQIYNAVFGVQVFVYVAFNLIMGFMSQGIDNLGHLGGLIGGYLAGLTLGMAWEKHFTPLQILSGIMGTLLLGGGLALYASRILLIVDNAASTWAWLVTDSANVFGTLAATIGVITGGYTMFLAVCLASRHRLRWQQVAAGIGYILLNSGGLLIGYVHNFHYLLG